MIVMFWYCLVVLTIYAYRMATRQDNPLAVLPFTAKNKPTLKNYIPDNQLRFYSGYTPKRLTDRIKAKQDQQVIKDTLHALYLKQELDHDMEDSNNAID